MQKRAFYYFLAIIGLNGLLGNLIGLFLPIYFKEIGFTGFQTGVFFAVSSIATILLSLPMGVSTDRLSIVWIMILSFFLMGISKVGLIVTQSFVVICVFAFVGSFGGRFYGTAINSMFFKMVGADNRKEAGLYQFISYAGSGLGMLLGSFIIADYSFRAVFIFVFITNWVLMGLSYFLPHNETVIIKVEEYKKAVLNPDVLFLTLIFSLSAFHWGAENVSYGRFLKEDLGLTIKQAGLYTSLGFIMVGIGAYLGVVLMDRRWVKSLQSLLAISFLLSGLFHILMCVHNVYWSFGFRLLHEIGDGFAFLVYFNGISKVFNMDKIGGCSAFITLCMSIAALVSAMLFGYLGDVLGNQWPMIISGIVMVLLPVLMKMKRYGIEQAYTVSGK